MATIAPGSSIQSNYRGRHLCMLPCHLIAFTYGIRKLTISITIVNIAHNRLLCRDTMGRIHNLRVAMRTQSGLYQYGSSIPNNDFHTFWCRKSSRAPNDRTPFYACLIVGCESNEQQAGTWSFLCAPRLPGT